MVEVDKKAVYAKFFVVLLAIELGQSPSDAHLLPLTATLKNTHKTMSDLTQYAARNCERGGGKKSSDWIERCFVMCDDGE